MLKPWTKVHSTTYLTYGEGWHKPFSPTKDFFDYVARTDTIEESLFGTKVEINYGRRYYQPIWREWIEYFNLPPTHFAVINLGKNCKVLGSDNIVLITKRFELDMTLQEIEALNNNQPTNLRLLLQDRLAHKIVYDRGISDGRRLRDTSSPRDR